MNQDQVLTYLQENKDKWFLSKDLVIVLGISQSAITRNLSCLFRQGLLLREKLKFNGFRYKVR